MTRFVMSIFIMGKVNKCLIFIIVGKLPGVFQFDSYLKDSVCYIYLFASKAQMPFSIPLYWHTLSFFYRHFKQPFPAAQGVCCMILDFPYDQLFYR